MTWVVVGAVVAAWAFGVWHQNFGPGYERRCARYTAKRIAERERERGRGIYEV